jgi:hypothetical protein
MVGPHHLGGFADRGLGAQGEDVTLAQFGQVHEKRSWKVQQRP